MIRASMFLLALAAAAPAAAQSITFHTTGSYQNVRAVIVGSETGGFVDIQAGTILASINPDEQNLTILGGVEADLEPNERREIILETFCLHPDRDTPRIGQTMAIIGRVDREVMAVVFDARGRAGHGHQAAVWALRSGNPPPRGEGAAVLRRLRLTVKPQ